MKGKEISLESIEAVHTYIYIYKGLLKNEKRESGITLIALIVTVIILLILAGVTLFYVLGDNGIIKVAQDAKKQTEDAIKNEQQSLGELANQLKEVYGGDNGNNNEGGDTPNLPIKGDTIADIVDKIQENNKTVEDANGNLIVIPGGFKVVPNSPEGIDKSQKVEYTYNGNGTPAVQDGIVIEDEEGNQFVWIPVGDIKNKDGTTTTITLGRYTFAYKIGITGLTQSADNYTESIKVIQNYSEYCELISSDISTPAKDLGEFVTKTKKNGGYYFARYEASKGTDDKVKSQADKVVWNYIDQPNAAIEARRMYNSSFVESDLINSYSWDTAIVFIQNYSENSSYALQSKKSDSLLNTGKAGDKVCNIHDMASNCREWTTEYCGIRNGYRSGVSRGDRYNGVGNCAMDRGSYLLANSNSDHSFRSIFYIK
ncbi:MAG: type II secretion system protein [Clostridia bacterium]|nr:type II secretion system protein [Clostridia bacterium]